MHPNSGVLPHLAPPVGRISVANCQNALYLEGTYRYDNRGLCNIFAINNLRELLGFVLTLSVVHLGHNVLLAAKTCGSGSIRRQVRPLFLIGDSIFTNYHCTS